MGRYRRSGATSMTAASLEGRVARCGCGREAASSEALSFFEFCGDGSREAAYCVCGFAECAHDPAEQAKNGPSGRRTVIEDGRCKGGKYEPRGDRGHDRWYCGCRGWD